MNREPQRPLRADAERNRQLILRTAERMFAQRGAPVPLNEIAHEAALGVGTVYRRFPDLQALVHALFVERFTVILKLAALASEQSDPARALRYYLLEAAQLRAEDQALDVILAHADIESKPLAQMRDDLALLIDGLVERATAAGDVRGDFASADVYAFLIMVGAVADRTHHIAPDAWRRYAEALLIGFGLVQVHVAHTTTLSDAQLRRSWPQPQDLRHRP